MRKDVYGQLHGGGLQVASPLGTARSIALPKQPCRVGNTARYVLSPFLPPACDDNGKWSQSLL